MFVNGKEVDVSTLVVAGIDLKDYPDFCDAYFVEGNYTDGSPITCIDLDELREKEYDLLRMKINEAIF